MQHRCILLSMAYLFFPLSPKIDCMKSVGVWRHRAAEHAGELERSDHFFVLLSAPTPQRANRKKSSSSKLTLGSSVFSSFYINKINKCSSHMVTHCNCSISLTSKSSWEKVASFTTPENPCFLHISDMLQQDMHGETQLMSEGLLWAH